MSDDENDEQDGRDDDSENQTPPAQPDEDGPSPIELEWGEPGVKRGQ